MEKHIQFFLNTPLLSIPTICMISLILRLHYFPYGVPVALDGLEYFWYANDISNLKRFPTEYNVGNNGWPIFLSSIFSIFNFNNFLDYMMIQRFVTIAISVLTIIPVYFICKRFFDRSYAVIGASLFVFEPRIIQNSLLGITDPLYVFLSATSFALFFSQRRNLLSMSFIVAGLAAIVRSEGIFIFVAISFAFFIIQRKEQKKISHYVFALGLYLCTILPMIFWRIKNNGGDLITGRFSDEAMNVITRYSIGNNEYGIINYFSHAVRNFVQLGGWSLIPVFILFLPFGIYYLLRHRNKQNVTIIVIIGILLIPVFLSFSVANDTRYIFSIFPIFCVVSLVTLNKINNKINKKEVFLMLILCGVMLSSTAYLENKMIDRTYQIEEFSFAKEVVKKTSGVNNYYPQSMYLKPALIPDKWPILKTSTNTEFHIFDTDNYQSLTQFIREKKNDGLSHIVIDDDENRPAFLKDVFYHEYNYPFLKKIFDSQQAGFTKYHAKIYEIDFSLIN